MRARDASLVVLAHLAAVAMLPISEAAGQTDRGMTVVGLCFTAVHLSAVLSRLRANHRVALSLAGIPFLTAGAFYLYLRWGGIDCYPDCETSVTVAGYAMMVLFLACFIAPAWVFVSVIDRLVIRKGDS